MADLSIARIAVVLPAEDPFSGWWAEAIQQIGLVCEVLSELPIRTLHEFDVLVLCGNGKAEDPEAIETWLEDGTGLVYPRALVACGSTWGLDRLLGVDTHPRRPNLGGTVVAPRLSPAWPKDSGPIVITSGARVIKSIADVWIGTPAHEPIVANCGAAYFFAPHLGQTFAQLVLGSSVECPGIVPGDGSVEWSHRALKAEMGSLLRFEERGKGTHFPSPHVDALRELWLKTVLCAVEGTRKRAMILWHLPRGLRHASIMAVDADGNSPTELFNLNSTLLMTHTRATIFSRIGSFAPDLYPWMRKVGHDVGFLYDPDLPGGWSGDRFRVTQTQFARIAGGVMPASVRFENGAWKGWMHPYQMLAESGIRSVMSKGGESAGCAGFLFGTAMPFVPMPHESPLIEVPYPLVQPGAKMREDAIEAVIEASGARHGILGGQIRLTQTRDLNTLSGLRHWIGAVRQSGGDFVTLDRWVAFERARRQVRVHLELAGVRATIEAYDAMHNVAILVSGRHVETHPPVSKTESQVVERYGQDWTQFLIDIPDRGQLAFRWIIPDALAA